MASGGGRHRLRELLIVAVGLAVAGGLYATGLTLYFGAQHRAAPVIIKDEQAPEDHLEALVRTISIDTTKNDLVLRVEVRAAGDLATPDGLGVTRPVSLDVEGATGKASYRYGAGDRISPVDVTVGMSGDTSSYPFDSYRAPVAVLASAVPPPSPGQQAASPVATPTRLAFDGTLSGYRVKTKPLPSGSRDVNLLALDLSIQRAPVTSAFAILILVLQGLLAIAAAALAVFIIRRHRRVEIPMLTWLAALLFAIIPLRNAMPGAPPIGAEVDVIVFFWAVTVIALALVSVLVTWLRQPPAPR